MNSVFSNVTLHSFAGDLRTFLNAESVCRLFTNDLALTPSLTLGNFTEAAFAGYAAVDVAGSWDVVQQSAAGVYFSRAVSITFGPATTTGVTPCRGIFLTNADGVIAAKKFNQPFLMTDWTIGLTLRPVVRVAAAGVLCLN